ncbi:MAG: acyltransferase [Bacteroidales bacterium]|nr:acyltransferase [Bacteroidales bacterium]
MNIQTIANKVFQLEQSADFEQLALELFRYQYAQVPVYGKFCKQLAISPDTVKTLEQIPFLPVDFFRTHRVSSRSEKAKLVFSSSGTTGASTSFHEVPEPAIYQESFEKAFQYFYGDIREYCVLALLPSYLERQGSSLVFMADSLIRASAHTDSGFYLHDLAGLQQKLVKLKAEGQKTLLLGVTYALLDLAEQFPTDFPELIIMETGGMKGQRKEMIREEVHAQLSTGFGVQKIHSEYGMTELLSQAYSFGDGIFRCPPWMRILIREMNDPLSLAKAGQSGGINIIDLANIYSCAFIAVQDIGRSRTDGSFEVLGRYDQSQIRGCNLLVM